VRFARGQAEDHCRSSIRGNQMNLGVPSTARGDSGDGDRQFRAIMNRDSGLIVIRIPGEDDH